MTSKLPAKTNLPRATTELADALDASVENNFISEQEASACRAYLTLNKDPNKCFYGADKETNLFQAFILGRSFQQLARSCAVPVEMIVLTAIKHRWDFKAQMLQNAGDSAAVVHSTKDLANKILEINLIAMDRELSDIYTGKKDARESIFMAKSPQELQKMLQLVMQANDIKNALAGGTATNAPTINITNQNAQVGPQNTPQVSITEAETIEALPEPSKLDQLKMIRDSELPSVSKKERGE